MIGGAYHDRSKTDNRWSNANKSHPIKRPSRQVRREDGGHEPSTTLGLITHPAAYIPLRTYLFYCSRTTPSRSSEAKKPLRARWLILSITELWAQGHPAPRLISNCAASLTLRTSLAGDKNHDTGKKILLPVQFAVTDVRKAPLLL